jgi:hypothetical protein
MDQIIVTRPDNTTWPLFSRANGSTVTKGEQKRELLGEDVVTMTIESATKLEFNRGDRITLFASTYILNSFPKEKKSSFRKFIYDLTWEGRQYDLIRANYLDEDADGVSISPDFELTGNLAFFMGVLINNLKRVFGNGVWILGLCPETDFKTLTFSNENCLQVLQRLCDKDKGFNKEFEIIENAGICTINLKETIGQNISLTFRYGKAKGLYSLERETISDKNIITRLYAFGSNRNIPWDYRGFSQRLKLPLNDLSYIEDSAAKALYGHIEGIKIFDDIYPRRTGTVTSLGSSIYQFIDSGMDFDLNAQDGEGNTLYLIANTSAKIHFNTGNLAGYEFELSSYSHSTRTFSLKPFTDERDQQFPDPATVAFQFGVGDKYVITDIIMPQTYISSGEAELEDAAEEYLAQNCQPRVKYSGPVDELYLNSLYPEETVVNVFNIGDNIPVEDDDFGIDKNIRVKAFTRDLFRVYKYGLTLSDITERSIGERLIATSIETEKLIALNKLNDVARARRSWISTRELLDMVFDTDGYFDGTNIKPNSIETLMLSVGSRSAQFSISCIITPNLNGNENLIRVGTGTLSHYAIEEAIRDWTITGSDVTLTDEASYYIYAKCIKTGTAATIIFSQSQIRVNDDANYYHFLLGVLHGIDESTGTRWISLTYGATAITGSYIRTGVITSQDGLTWFDLDNGVIQGEIKFKGGQTAKRIFNTQPVTPYSIGDLYTNGVNIYRCFAAKETGSFDAGDWELATEYDKTQTIINGGIITTGRIEVGPGALGEGNAGISGAETETDPDDDIRFWAGNSFANRATAPMRILNDGRAIFTKGLIAGWIIDSDAIYTGTKKTSAGYTENGITIASNGSIRSKFFEILESGKAKFESVDSIFKSMAGGAGDLSGTVENMQANIPKAPRIDRIYPTNDEGTADLTCNGVTRLMTLGSGQDEEDACANFVTAWQSAWDAVNVYLTYNQDGLGNWYVQFEAEVAGTDFTGSTSIANVSGYLDGSVDNYQANNNGQKRIDRILMTGTSGEANILCDGVTRKAIFYGSLNQTALNWVNSHAGAYSPGGVLVTSSNNYILLEAIEAGVDFTGNTTITNVPVEDVGSVIICANNIFEIDTNTDKGTIRINYVGYAGGTDKFRCLDIGDGKGNRIARFYGSSGGNVISLNAPNIGLPNIPTSSSGLQPGALYRNGNYVQIV